MPTKKKEDAVYDIIIVGGGCAGLPAAMYSGRFGLKTLILAEQPGGTIITTDVVENYPGFIRLTGLELATKLQEHAESYKDVTLKAERVVDVAKKGAHFWVKTQEDEYLTKTIIFATGTEYKKLNVPGEKELMNKGVHYCALCVLPNTNIVTNPNSKHIKDMKNEKVLTAQGTFEKIYKKIKKQYHGEVINLRPRYFHNTLQLTPDHLVLATRPQRTHYNYRMFCKKKYGKEWMAHIREYLLYEPQWIPAKNLQKSDYLLYPILKETKIITTLRISDVISVSVDKEGNCYNAHETHSSVRVPNVIKIDKYFLNLAGYYIAEGHNGRGPVFSFNKNEVSYAQDVKSLIKKVFKLEGYIDESQTSLQVHCYSNIVGTFFKTLFGGHAWEKKLPDWMLYLPKEQQAQVFRTMWFGDGSPKEKSLHYVTSSKQLAHQLKILLLRLGAIPHLSVKTVEKQNKKIHSINGRRIIARHDKYELEIGGAWLEPLCKMMHITHPHIAERKWVNYYGWFDNNYAVIPINNITKENYHGPVFDLSVENAHSFTTDVACVHNCDGAFYKEKIIGVVGGSDSAAKEALLLTQWAKKVYIIYRGEHIRPEPINMTRVEQNKKIEIINNTNITEIKGTEKVTGVTLDKAYKGSTDFKLDAVFVEIGHIALTQLPKKLGVTLNKKGEVLIDREAKTNVPGIYAAGDCVDTVFKQAITGAGEGVSAAYSAYQYISKEDE